MAFHAQRHPVQRAVVPVLILSLECDIVPISSEASSSRDDKFR